MAQPFAFLPQNVGIQDMRYQQRRFSVGGTSPEYRDGYARWFGNDQSDTPPSASPCGCDNRTCPRCQREDDTHQDEESDMGQSA